MTEMSEPPTERHMFHHAKICCLNSRKNVQKRMVREKECPRIEEDMEANYKAEVISYSCS